MHALAQPGRCVESPRHGDFQPAASSDKIALKRLQAFATERAIEDDSGATLAR